MPSRLPALAAPTPGYPVALAAAAVQAQGFDFDSLYVRGAVAMDIWGPKDKVSRRMSAKLYTVRQDARLVEKLGIYDITYQSDVFGQKFSIGSALSQTAPLDDRKPGYPPYVLNISFTLNGNTRITFGRPGNEDQLATSVRRLFVKRAEQALDEGSKFRIGGNDFLALGQGGAISNILFFPSDLASKLDSSDVYDMAPVLAAELMTRGPDGRQQRLSGKRPLGYVSGQFYYLVFDESSGSWRAEPGDVP